MKKSSENLKYSLYHLRMKIPPQFFLGDTLEVAKRLLGSKLCTAHDGELASGIIVEVEAYCDRDDLASHSYKGRTARNEVMFWDPGYCYVYFIYGMHYCVNVVTECAGRGAAVLIRSILPLEGIDIMLRRRKSAGMKALTNGPGKLCQALGIDNKMQGQHLSNSNRIWLEAYEEVPANRVKAYPRVGISKSKDLLWRFAL